MRAMMKFAALVAAVCLAALPCMARQEQQSSSQQQTGDAVADAARKAREQKKDAPKPKKVYTDDDISPRKSESSASGNAAVAPQATETPVQSTAASSSEGAPIGTAGSGEAKSDEASWRKRFHAQRDKIAQAEKELDILQRETDKAQVQYYSDPQKALNEQYSRKDINEKNAKIEAKKQEIATLKQQLSDMEDDLRKAGGDPGWARE